MNLKKYFLGIGVFVAASATQAAGLYDEIIAPAIEECPGFLTGDTQIKVQTGIYDQWEGGRLFFKVTCYEPTKRSGGISVTKKTSVENDPDVDSVEKGTEKVTCGSIIQSESQVLGEKIPITGSDISLYYFSNRVTSRTASYLVKIPLWDYNSNVTGFTTSGNYAGGRTFSGAYSNIANQVYNFVWDGLDISGNDSGGTTSLNLTVNMLAHGKSIPFTYKIPVGAYRTTGYGLGSWTPSIYHFYDPASGRLYKGSGSKDLFKSETLAGGNLRVVEKDGSDVYIFNSAGRHLQTLFPRTGAVKYSFNYTAGGLLESITDFNNRTTTFNRDVTNKVTSITSPKGQITTLSYSGGNLVSVQRPDSKSYSMTYKTGTGLLETFTEPGGDSSTFTYDSKGFLIKDEHVDGKSISLSSAIEGSHDNKVIYLTSKMGLQNKIEFSNTQSSTGEYTKYETSPSGESNTIRLSEKTSSYAYSNRSTVQNYLGDSRFNNNALYLSQIIEKRGAISNVTSFNKSSILADPNDPFSVIKLIDTVTKNGKIWTTEYDASTKTETFTSPEGRVRKITYDSQERVIEIKNPGRPSAKYSYFSDGSLRSLESGGRKTIYTYDENGYLASSTNSFGQTTRYINNLLGKPIKTILANGKYISFIYNDSGAISSIRTPAGDVHNFELSVWDSIKKYLPPVISGGSETAYEYDDDRRLIEVDKPNGKYIKYYYNSVTGRLDSVELSEGTNYLTYGVGSYDKPSETLSYDDVKNVYSYTGDLISKITQYISGANPISVGFKYNSDFKVAQLSLEDSANRYSLKSEFDQDGLQIRIGELKRAIGPNNDITSYRIGDLILTLKYSEHGEIINRSLSYKGKLLVQYQYDHDLLGRISSESGPGYRAYFSYDKRGRFIGRSLNGRVFSSFKYDENGNLISGWDHRGPIAASYDNQDRLVKWNGLEFAYDNDGFLSQIQNGNETKIFVYDSSGGLKQVEIKNNGLTVQTISYLLDSDGNRIQRTDGSTTFRYVYEGQRLIAEVNSTGQIIKRYAYFSGSTSPDYMYNANSLIFFFKDSRGSIVKAFDVNTGAIVQEVVYSDWGQQLSNTKPDLHPFGFAGGIYDTMTGFVKFGVRDYDPQTGRWTSKDPILFEGGDANLYSYVSQDPINATDPEGLKTPIDTIVNEIGKGGACAIPIIIPVVIVPTKAADCQTNWNGGAKQCKEKTSNAEEMGDCMEGVNQSYKDCVQTINK